MDERLKKKLELLGEPTLPDSLTAEELFRRMDSGELVLPEEPEAAPDHRVIPWMKVLRRGVPIAACLALVVFIAQGGIWRMGSGGAKFSGNAAALQESADQSALTNGGDDAPMESYSLDDEAAAPEPFRSIVMEDVDDAEMEEVFDDVEAEADGDADVAETDGQKSAWIADSADFGSSADRAPSAVDRDPPRNPPMDSYDDVEEPPTEHPDTGGPPLEHPDTGGPSSGEDEPFNPDTGNTSGPNPDTGGGPQENPDSGTAGPYEIAMHEIPQLLWNIARENVPEGSSEQSIGMPGMSFHDWDGGDVRTLEYVTGYFSYYNEDGERVASYSFYCSVTWVEQEERFYLELIEREEWEPPLFPDAGFKNPDMGGESSQDDGVTEGAPTDSPEELQSDDPASDTPLDADDEEDENGEEDLF